MSPLTHVDCDNTDGVSRGESEKNCRLRVYLLRDPTVDPWGRVHPVAEGSQSSSWLVQLSNRAQGVALKISCHEDH